MGDENPIRTLVDYSKPSHEGYRNTIELPVGNNVVPLRSDIIRLVQNRCSFHGLRSEDPNQHLKDFLKLVDSLDLDGENRERMRMRLFRFSLRDQASNWLERLPAGSISTWEDLTTRFLAQLFPPGRTSKLRNDILIRTIDQSASGKLRDLNPEESWAILEDLALYDNESWNDPRDFAKPVKAITLPQDVLSTSDCRLFELENQIQHLMEAHLALTQPTQVNKITTPCEIFSGPHDTQNCMENLEQAFVEYVSSCTDEVGVLKAITDRIAGTLPSDTIKNQKLRTHPVLSARSYPILDPQCSSHPSTSINAIKAHFNDAIIKPQQPEEPEPTLEDEFKDLHLNLPVLEILAHALIYNVILDKYIESLELGKNGSAFVQGETLVKMGDPGLFTLPYRLGDSKPFDTLADLGSCVNIIPLYLFKKLNIGLLEETDHIFGLADRTKSYPEEFLATANAVIDCRMSKIAVGEGITRSVFSVKGINLGEEEAPYWTTLGKRESYKPRPSTDKIGAKPPYYARKDSLDCHLPREWEISRDVELNPFKDTLVFRRMVEFLGVIPIYLKCNMRESEDLIRKPINWDKPPKNEDGAWHAKIRLIDPDGEEFTKTLQSIPTTRKLSERESPREIIDLDTSTTLDV
ncbi:MAK10-like protein [Tanacetum coccineum]